MRKILLRRQKELETINFCAPQIKFISNVSGKLVTQDEITNPDLSSAQLARANQIVGKLVEYVDVLGRGLTTRHRLALAEANSQPVAALS